MDQYSIISLKIQGKKKTYFFFPFKQQSRHQTHYLTLNPCECPSKNPKPSQSVDPEKALIAYCFRIQVPYMWFQGEKKIEKGKCLLPADVTIIMQVTVCYRINENDSTAEDLQANFPIKIGNGYIHACVMYCRPSSKNGSIVSWTFGDMSFASCARD